VPAKLGLWLVAVGAVAALSCSDRDSPPISGPEPPIVASLELSEGRPGAGEHLIQDRDVPLVALEARPCHRDPGLAVDSVLRDLEDHFPVRVQELDCWHVESVDGDTDARTALAVV